MPRLLLACALAFASLSPASVARAATSTCPTSAGWVDGRAYVRGSLVAHPVVGVGEIHAASEYFAFIDGLLDDPGVRGAIDDVVVEFGNARHQPILDRYLLALENIPARELAQVWSDHAESPTGPFESPLYAGLVEHVRRVNQQSGGKRLRIVAADLPIDWSRVDTLEDYRALGRRSDHMWQRVISEVLDKGRRGLLVFGGAHLSRHSPAPGAAGSLQTSANVIEASHPGSLVTLNAVVSFGGQQTLAAPLLEGVPAGCAAPLADHALGALPGPGVLRMTAAGVTQTVQSAPESVRRRRDLFDAYLWLGPESALTYVHAPQDAYRDDAHWRELDRRARIRFGLPLDPASRTSGILRTLPQP